VHDLDSALAAINVIVEQGEGASADVEDSHYRRFVRLREEYAEQLEADPDFQPGRPVLPNPYATEPNDVAENAEINLIDDAMSADICNLFDGCYELMVQILGRLFIHAEESNEELATLADLSVTLMLDVLTPLGSAITLLPAGPSHPGLHAGPSFRLSRGAAVPAHREAARHVFHERLRELARYCQFLRQPNSPEVLDRVRSVLINLATRLETA
jgi:hypothetical protein